MFLIEASVASVTLDDFTVSCFDVGCDGWKIGFRMFARTSRLAAGGYISLCKKCHKD